MDYDPERGLFKLNQAFSFEKEIYADRFLLQNKELVTQKKSILLELKRKREELLRQKEGYMNFSKTGQSMMNILNNAKAFARE